MFYIIIILLELINLFFLIRLNRCGQIVRVEQKNVYVPQKKVVKKVVQEEVVDD